MVLKGLRSKHDGNNVHKHAVENDRILNQLALFNFMASLLSTYSSKAYNHTYCHVEKSRE